MIPLTEKLQTAAECLADNLLAAEPFVLYRRAQARLEADDEASDLLEQLSAQHGEIRKNQQSNTVSEADVSALRKLQIVAQENETIMEFAQAQQNAIQYFKEINQEISQALGLDFASFAKQGCC